MNRNLVTTVSSISLSLLASTTVLAQEKIWSNPSNDAIRLSSYGPIPVTNDQIFLSLLRSNSEKGFYSLKEGDADPTLLLGSDIGKTLEESVIVDGKQIFISYGDNDTSQLWKNDNGQISELSTFPQHAGRIFFLQGLRVVGKEVFFILWLHDAPGVFLYKTDGTTVELVSADLTSSGALKSGSDGFFGAYGFDVRDDAVYFGSGTALKKYVNGTITTLKDLGTTSFGIRLIGNKILAQRTIGDSSELVAITEGSDESVTLGTGSMFIRSSNGANNKLFYGYTATGTNESVEMVTDGTPGGTKSIAAPFADENPALVVSGVTSLPFKSGAIMMVTYRASQEDDTPVKGATFFVDGDSSVKLVDRAGYSADYRVPFTSDSEFAFFPACTLDRVNGSCSLYKTDGSLAGTQVLGTPFQHSECVINQPTNLTVINGDIYYRAHDTVTCIDGSTATARGRLFKYVVDRCPSDDTKVKAGVCGCGVPDTDSDSDGTADCLEQPVDPKSPDLVVRGLSVSSKSIRQGRVATVTMRVHNKGKRRVKTSFKATWFLSKDTILSSDDITVGFKTIRSLAAGATAEIRLQKIIPARWTAGKYWLIGTVDSDSVVDELSETNNSRRSSSQITIRKKG